MILRTIAFVLPLGLDTLALAIALGLRGFRPWRPALLFTIFETAMPVFGIALARVVDVRFAATAAVVAGIVLTGLGIHAIREAIQGERVAGRISLGSARSLLVAGLAISTDEIAAGFPLGVSGLPIGTVLLAIAIQTVVVTVVGIAVGRHMRSTLAQSASRYAGIGAGVVFTAVGLWLIGERIGPHVLRWFS